jgi:lambda repressor-like predicted transcriptional regulator
MNLYKLHTNPESLLGYQEAMKDPEMAWETHENNHDKLRELEDLWAKSAEYSYRYAAFVLENRFPKGEDAIATDAWYSYLYAKYVLKPLGIIGFPKGEDAIATDAWYSYLYAKDVLEDRFPQGEPVIAQNIVKINYQQEFGILL